MNPDLNLLVDEYSSLFAGNPELNWEQIEAKLVDHHDWTTEGAFILVKLVRLYGFAILRNAAALALACQVVDGDSGL